MTDTLDMLGVSGVQKIALQGLLSVIGGEEKLFSMLQGAIDHLFETDPKEAEKMASEMLPKLLPAYNVTVVVDDELGPREIYVCISKKQEEAQTTC